MSDEVYGLLSDEVHKRGRLSAIVCQWRLENEGWNEGSRVKGRLAASTHVQLMPFNWLKSKMDIGCADVLGVLRYHVPISLGFACMHCLYCWINLAVGYPPPLVSTH